ncbi:hypothetical protein ElyMa_007035200 [Elysia marginata]|uniref:Uncharacterized protein n=1 Tax=Elysia marginata TaxID=1093978 RepID=A0AAV4JVK4_9GAST|nr:hypothetical protein ElyMa_007035200 [Elysia marginata]
MEILRKTSSMPSINIQTATHRYTDKTDTKAGILFSSARPKTHLPLKQVVSRTICLDHSSTFGPRLLVSNPFQNEFEETLTTFRLRKLDDNALTQLASMDTTQPETAEKIYRLFDSAHNRDQILHYFFHFNHFPPLLFEPSSFEQHRAFIRAKHVGDSRRAFFDRWNDYKINYEQLRSKTIETTITALETKMQHSTRDADTLPEDIQVTLDWVTALKQGTLPDKTPSRTQLEKSFESDTNRMPDRLKAISKAKSFVAIDKAFIDELEKHLKSGTHPPLVLEIQAGNGILADELQKRNIPVIATDACFCACMTPGMNLIKNVYFSIDTDAIEEFTNILKHLKQRDIPCNPYILCCYPDFTYPQAFIADIILNPLFEMKHHNLKVIIIGRNKVDIDIFSEVDSAPLLFKEPLTEKLKYVGHGDESEKIFEYRLRAINKS